MEGGRGKMILILILLSKVTLKININWDFKVNARL